MFEIYAENQGVEVINICDLMKQLFGDRAFSWDRNYQEDCKVIHAWIDSNDAYYYANSREHFSILCAIDEAVTAGKTKVVVEDLS